VARAADEVSGDDKSSTTRNIRHSSTSGPDSLVFTAKAGNVWGRYAARLTMGEIGREVGGFAAYLTGQRGRRNLLIDGQMFLAGTGEPGAAGVWPHCTGNAELPDQPGATLDETFANIEAAVEAWVTDQTRQTEGTPSVVTDREDDRAPDCGAHGSS
jgi:hypothetical protein